jgi:hypothetical protein
LATRRDPEKAQRAGRARTGSPAKPKAEHRAEESEADARQPGSARRRDPSPESVDEALARARDHGRAAAAEALEMVHALLDVGSLATSGEPSDTHRLLGPLASLLEDLSARLAGDAAAASTPILEAITEALDVEIARWEERAGDDPEARAVLRAFLGVRELLWEFGVRRGPGETPDPAPTNPRATRVPRPGRGPRIQRVPVEG